MNFLISDLLDKKMLRSFCM